MANLEALPNELLARIISLSPRRSLAQLRLTNRRLETIAVTKLFERATLYVHWADPNDENSEGRQRVMLLSAQFVTCPIITKAIMWITL